MSVFEEQPTLACQSFPLSEPQSPSLSKGDKVHTSSSDYYEEQYVMQNGAVSYPVKEQHILILIFFLGNIVSCHQICGEVAT